MGKLLINIQGISFINWEHTILIAERLNHLIIIIKILLSGSVKITQNTQRKENIYYLLFSKIMKI